MASRAPLLTQKFAFATDPADLRIRYGDFTDCGCGIVPYALSSMAIPQLRRPLPVTSGLQKHRLMSVFAACLSLRFAASAEISVGDRRLSIDCEGEPHDTPTIVLIAGGGRTAKDWAKIQPAVSSFARVCSYDRSTNRAPKRCPARFFSSEHAASHFCQPVWLQPASICAIGSTGRNGCASTRSLRWCR
jgi:hypothetical protein